jgi:hypothetical protein
MTEADPAEDKDTVEDAEDDVDPAVILPPPSATENHRDWLLRTLDRPFFQALGIVVLLLVIGTGALFFFLLMGWQTLCRPRTDCDPRNWWYSWSIQALNVCFTYMATASMPWRCTNAIHTFGWSCPHRSNAVGHDLYGLTTRDIWFWVPAVRRGGILVVLLLNCLTQYANQGTRIKYYTYELQDTSPGNIWTNVFFAASFLFAGIGGSWMAYELGRVRKQHPPDFFPPGPIDLARNYWRQHWGEKKEEAKEELAGLESAAGGIDSQGGGDEQQQNGSAVQNPDPTREVKRRSLIPTNRSSMRMFAM